LLKCFSLFWITSLNWFLLESLPLLLQPFLYTFFKYTFKPMISFRLWGKMVLLVSWERYLVMTTCLVLCKPHCNSWKQFSLFFSINVKMNSFSDYWPFLWDYLCSPSKHQRVSSILIEDKRNWKYSFYYNKVLTFQASFHEENKTWEQS